MVDCRSTSAAPQSAGATELVQLLAPAARVARLVCTLMGRVHHKLLGAPGKVQTSSYLKQLCHDIVSSLGRENVTCHLRCRELAAEKVTSLALLIFELLTNSFKHAFPGNQSGHVEVCPKRDGKTLYGAIPIAATDCPNSSRLKRVAARECCLFVHSPANWAESSRGQEAPSRASWTLRFSGGA
jgi:two-component sensor histidine kinase